MQGIFAIMCPDCEVPLDQRRPAAGTAEVAADAVADDVTGVRRVRTRVRRAVRLTSWPLPGPSIVGVA